MLPTPPDVDDEGGRVVEAVALEEVAEAEDVAPEDDAPEEVPEAEEVAVVVLAVGTTPV